MAHREDDIVDPAALHLTDEHLENGMSSMGMSGLGRMLV